MKSELEQAGDRSRFLHKVRDIQAMTVRRGSSVFALVSNLDECFRKRLARGDVFREPLEHVLVPAPVLEHLGWGLYKVSRAFGEGSGVPFSLRAQAMHDVTWCAQIERTNREQIERENSEMY